jgi:hypothetical protein
MDGHLMELSHVKAVIRVVGTRSGQDVSQLLGRVLSSEDLFNEVRV